MTGGKWNHNLMVTFVFRITSALSQGLWNSGTGSNYIYYLEDRRNTLVGLVQGIQGIFIPLASLPGGYLADRTRRDRVLQVLGVAGFVAIALISAAVLVEKKPLWFFPEVDLKFGLLCVGYCFMGITQASNPIVESILADSVPTGGRSGIYTSLYFLGMLSRAVGPLMAALIFMVDGNVWSVSILGKALLFGMLASIVPTAALFFFNDNRSLGSESEAHGRHLEQPQEEAGLVEPTKQPASQDGPRICGLSQSAIPFILSTSDLIYGLASGCTIKFFPIFFAKEVKLAPVAVNVLMAAQPIIIGLFATLSQRISVHIGRIQVLLLLRLIGWSAMAVMGLWTGLWSNAPAIIAIFLIRTGVNNAGYPIQKSVLMDHVPKRNRGKWSAVDSLTMFGWSGSAFLGGIIVDRAGFDWCFLITAIAQATGWAVLMPLLALVPSKEIQSGSESAEARLPLLDSRDPEDLEEGSGRETVLVSPTDAPTSPQSDLACAVTPKPGAQEPTPKTGDEEEFVKLVGSLKSPRRSIDSWSEQ